METKVFVFQLHNDQTEDSDYVLIAESFETIKKAFDEKVNELKRIGVEFEVLVESEFDEESNEYNGFFKVLNMDGSTSIGKVYDYHLFQ